MFTAAIIRRASGRGDAATATAHRPPLTPRANHRTSTDRTVGTATRTVEHAEPPVGAELAGLGVDVRLQLGREAQLLHPRSKPPELGCLPGVLLLLDGLQELGPDAVSALRLDDVPDGRTCHLKQSLLDVVRPRDG